eukprot:9497790-Pyramimonas_sp.AAC.2
MCANSLAADLLVLVVLLSKNGEGGLNDTTTQAEHQVEGGLCSRRPRTRFVRGQLAFETRPLTSV